MRLVRTHSRSTTTMLTICNSSSELRHFPIFRSWYVSVPTKKENCQEIHNNDDSKNSNNNNEHRERSETKSCREALVFKENTTNEHDKR